MQKHLKIAPEGSKDMLFQDCLAFSDVTQLVQKTLTGKGYNLVITPGFEFYDLFSVNNSGIAQEEMFKTTDSKGRIMAARCDSTLPIARLVSTRLKNEHFPLRLYYSQPVYRAVSELSGKSNEIYQIGTELLGLKGIEADIEVLTSAIDSIHSVISDYRIEIGHAGFTNSFINRLNAPKEIKDEVRKACENKNFSLLKNILDSLEESDEAKALAQLPRLFGGEEVFEKAEKLCVGYDEKEALNYLKDVFFELKKLNLEDKIIIDLGQVLKIDYYSGIVFSGYAVGHGDSIISGGRYDELMSCFNMPMGAAGFAIDINALTKIYINDMKNRIYTEKNPEERPIRIALTKGRLEKKTVDLLKTLDYNTEQLENKGRKLILTTSKGETTFEIVLAKAADVITYIENGVCDLGVVGKDTILENGNVFYELMDLGFGSCKFALATQKGTNFYDGYGIKTIATKYPKVARKYFESKGMDVRIIKIEGSVELGPLVGLSDAIVDIVETGSTLKENGLEVIEDIAPISARLIASVVSLKLNKQKIEDLIDQIENVLKN